MGCDIHIMGEKRDGDGWRNCYSTAIDEIEQRSYNIFGFLANVRNYSDVEPISQPRGFPEDASYGVKEEFVNRWGGDGHTPSWLTVDELLAFDYDKMTEDRRCTKQIAPNIWTGGDTCEPGDGRALTYREFLGEQFYGRIEQLKRDGVERIVFWFDN